MKIKFSLLLLTLLIGCSAPKVCYDFDTKMNFSQLKTYHIFENAGEGLNELDIKRIIAAIDYKMELQGFKKQENPDFFIDFKAQKRDNNNRNTVAIGFGNVGRNSNIGISGGIPIDNKKYIEDISIDFVEATEEQLLFWQGILSSKIPQDSHPNKRTQYINKVIYKILNGFPPKK